MDIKSALINRAAAERKVTRNGYEDYRSITGYSIDKSYFYYRAAKDRINRKEIKFAKEILADRVALFVRDNGYNGDKLIEMFDTHVNSKIQLAKRKIAAIKREEEIKEELSKPKAMSSFSYNMGEFKLTFKTC